MLANFLNIYTFANTEFKYFIADGNTNTFFRVFEIAKSCK
jgi:hypothetical protein